MPRDFNINMSTIQGRVPVTVFRVKGSIDASTSDQFVAQAEQAIQSGTRDLLIDLKDVEYLSSAGLRALHKVYKEIREGDTVESDAVVSQGIRNDSYKARHLKLVHASPEVMSVLKMSGMDMYLEIHNDLELAVSSF